MRYLVGEVGPILIKIYMTHLVQPVVALKIAPFRLNSKILHSLNYLHCPFSVKILDSYRYSVFFAYSKFLSVKKADYEILTNKIHRENDYEWVFLVLFYFSPLFASGYYVILFCVQNYVWNVTVIIYLHIVIIQKVPNNVCRCLLLCS